MKKIVIAAALVLMSSVAVAQEKAPATPEECLKMAYDIAQAAEPAMKMARPGRYTRR